MCSTWLGFELDLERGCISAPPDKLDSFKMQIMQAIGCTCIGARPLASIVGKIISLSLAFGPVARLMTRSMYALLNSRNSLCHRLHIDPNTRKELGFWEAEIEKFNGQDIWHSPSAVRVVYSDASVTGYGGYSVEHGCHIAHWQWDSYEVEQSSTWWKLHAVRLVLESLAGKLANE